MKERRTYQYLGKPHTVAELATIAGCPYFTMYSRLRDGKTAAQAVALGGAQVQDGNIGDPTRHNYQGRAHTVRELAQVAGCSYIAMYSRLRSGYSAEQAVAMGATKAKSEKRAPPRRDPKIQARDRGPVLAADAPVLQPAPAPVVRQPLPVDPRYGVTQAPSVFGKLRPGEYLDSDTHLGRVYGSRA